MKRLLVICYIFVFSINLYGGLDGNKLSVKDKHYLMALDIGNYFTKLQKIMAERLPIKLSQYTTVIGVIGIGTKSRGRLEVKKSINLEKFFKTLKTLGVNEKDVDIQEYKIYAFEEDRKVLCRKDSVTRFLLLNKDKVIYSYLYENENGVPLFSYTVEKNDCKDN